MNNGQENGNYPAFPIENACHGLSKREYFAGLAMQSYIISLSASGNDTRYENVAMAAVNCADALLAELSKPQ